MRYVLNRPTPPPPSLHDTYKNVVFKVGPPSARLAHSETNIVLKSCAPWARSKRHPPQR